MSDPFEEALKRARGGGAATLDPFEEAKKRAAAQQATPSALGLDRWRDVGRGLANTAAGLLTAPGEGLARLAGEVLPENYGGRASKQAADQLKAQREGVAQAVGPYETGTGVAAQIVGNLGVAALGGDPLQTATAASSKDASTLALVGDLVRKAGGKGSIAEQAADEISKLADSPATRGAFEYAVGRLTAGAAKLVAKKVRARISKNALAEGRTEQLIVPPESGPPGAPQTVERAPIRPERPALGDAPDAYQAAIARAKALEADDLARRTAALGDAVPRPPAGPPVIRTADVPDPRLVGQGVPRRPNTTKVGSLAVESPIAGPSAMENTVLTDRAPAGRVPQTTPKEDQRVLKSFLRGENLDASRRIREARGGVTNVEDLLSVGRTNFFPGPEALASLATKPAATAGIGAAIGAIHDDEDRVRGAMIGGAAGYGLGVALRGISQYRALKAMNASPSLAGAPPATRAAYATLAEGIDLTGELEDGMRAKAKGPWSVRIQKIYDSAGDAVRPLDRLGAKAEQAGLDFDLTPTAALNHALDVGSTQHRFFFDKAVDPMTGQAVGPSFRDLHEPLAGNPGAIKDAWTYVVGKRIVDRGIDAFNGDAAKFQAYADAVQHLGQNADNVAFAGRLNDYVDSLGRYGVASGLWTPTEWQAMRGADEIYAPFRDVEAKIQREMGLAGAGGGRGGSLNVGGLKKRYGTPEQNPTIANPARSLAEYTKQVIRRADQARINRSLFAAADAMGLEGEAILTTLPDSDPRILHAQQATMALAAGGMTPTEAAAKAALYVDKISGANDVIEAVDEAGRRRYAILNAPEVRGALRAMRETPGQKLTPEIMRILSLPRRVITATTTGLAPRFALAKNPMMDIPDVAARVPGMRLGDFGKGYAASLRQSLYTHLQEIAPTLANTLGPSQLADEASRAGLSNTSLFQRDLSPASIANQLAPTSPGRAALGGVQKAISEPLLLAESVGAAFDMGPRLAAYNAVRRQLEAQGVKVLARNTKAAAIGARSAVDYRRSSSLPLLQFIYQVVPFARASVLATQRFASFAKQYPARAATLASGAAVLGMIEWVTNAGNEKMNDRPVTERVQGPEFTLSDGTVVQLPMAPEINVFRTGMYQALNELQQKDPNSAKLLKESLGRALPPGFGEAIASGRPITAFAPPVAQQLLENDANRTVFGDRPVVPGPLQRLDPAMQRFPSTPPTYDAVAALLRKTGVASKASPLQVENVLGSMTNGFTPAVLSLTDPIAEKLTGTSAQSRVPPPAITSSLNPASAIIKRSVPTRTESESKFYELRDEITTRQNSMRKLLSEAEQTKPGPARDAKIAALRSYLGENQAYLNDEPRQLASAVGDAVTELRDQETVIQDQHRAKQLTTDEANAALDQIRLRRQDLLRRATARLRVLLKAR